MKHVTALIIKVIMVTAVMGIFLNLFDDISFTEIIYISLSVTILAYIIGDLLILPMSNNTIATVADMGLAFVTIYLVDLLWINEDISIIGAIVASIVLGVGEWFFHKYIARNVLEG